MKEQIEIDSQKLKWWGEFDFKYRQLRAWRFGSTYVRIYRDEQEWRLEWHNPVSQQLDRDDWTVVDPGMKFPKPVKTQRFMFKNTDCKLILVPRLADRSFVVKPVHPINIAAGQQGTLYISTPVWLAGYTNGQKKPLFEIPLTTPKDTWFGPNAQTGELCYATPVDGRTELSLLTPHPLRAVTPVYFRNLSHEHLRLDRMSVPVDSLPLFYCVENSRLWTSQIRILHENKDKPPRIKIENSTPPQAGEVFFLQAPRAPESSLFHMFDSLF